MIVVYLYLGEFWRLMWDKIKILGFGFIDYILLLWFYLYKYKYSFKYL